jgi:transposase InsO family protein
VHSPIPARPGQLERFDCEYRRNGTAKLFIFLDAHNSWRKVKVTDRRSFGSQGEARIAVFQFIEGFYNPSRRHSALGYLSPIEYERKYDDRNKSA